MSFVSACNMEIVTEQPGIASTLIDDVDKLISFVRRYNNSIPEYIRVARMYFFGTPIRRTGSGFRRATPGYIRLKLLQENSDDADFDDEIDVPLSPNGDLDLHRVKLWWGIRTCRVRSFHPSHIFPLHQRSSSHSSHSAGKSSTRAIAKRSRAPQYTTSPTAAKTTCSSSSSQERRTSTSSKSSAHGPTSSSGSGAPSRTTPRGSSTASSRSAPSRGSYHSSARSTCSLPPRSPSWLSCPGRVSSSWPCPSTRARVRSEPTSLHHHTDA
ncbi:hypothetical protein EDB85DRAFT_222232 [Lactarius pseudohatsudake]|nr:hypothetical protein EDB85DRAFT_222232 [Lactarius pseudohatsudake]